MAYIEYKIHLVFLKGCPDTIKNFYMKIRKCKIKKCQLPYFTEESFIYLCSLHIAISGKDAYVGRFWMGSFELGDDGTVTRKFSFPNMHGLCLLTELGKSKLHQKTKCFTHIFRHGECGAWYVAWTCVVVAPELQHIEQKPGPLLDHLLNDITIASVTATRGCSRSSFRFSVRYKFSNRASILFLFGPFVTLNFPLKTSTCF